MSNDHMAIKDGLMIYNNSGKVSISVSLFRFAKQTLVFCHIFDIVED